MTGEETYENFHFFVWQTSIDLAESQKRPDGFAASPGTCPGGPVTSGHAAAGRGRRPAAAAGRVGGPDRDLGLYFRGVIGKFSGEIPVLRGSGGESPPDRHHGPRGASPPRRVV
jgi:hypothetical protein